MGSGTGEDDAQGGYVEYAAVLSLEQAKRSILKDREDILALLDGATETMDAHLLLLFTQSTNNDAVLKLRVIAIKTARAGSEDVMTPLGRKPLQELLSLSIPEPDVLQRKSSTLVLHAVSGTLYQYNSKHLAVYDLIGLVARLADHTHLGQFEIATCLRISPSSVALNTATSVSIIDTQYRSLQADCSLQIQQNSQSLYQAPEKPENKPSDRTSTRLLSYFAPLNLIVALQGRRLIAMQLSAPVVQKVPQKRKSDGLLVDSIGRGIVSMHEKSTNHKPSDNIPKALGNFLPSCRSDDKWNKQKNFVDNHFTKGELDKFETAMISQLGIIAREDTKNPVNRQDVGIYDERKVHYLFSKMFLPDVPPSPLEGNDGSRKLKIRFFPAGIVPHLLRKSFLSLDQIETSLKHHGALPLSNRLATEALIHALAEWDPSLKSLLSLLESPVPLRAQELAHVLQVSLDHKRAAENTDSVNMITNGELRSNSRSNHNMQLTNGDTPSSPNLPRLNPDNASIAHELLHQTLTRLSLHSSKDITRGLRTTLSPTVLLELIDHLRISLASAGWLTPYTESPPSLFPNASTNTGPHGNNDNTQISKIAKLLNCLLDAIGSGGWLLGSSMDDEMSETADTITYMKAEISAALEGVEEATYLRGMLGELLLYAMSYETSQDKRVAEKAGQRTITSITPPEIGGSGSALPLGMKANQGAGTTKVGAGGELLKRSMRDIGRLKDRQVPKYSFERIVI